MSLDALVTQRARTQVRVVVLDGVDWRWCSENPVASAPLWSLVGATALAGKPPAFGPAAGGCAALLQACAEPTTPPAVAALLSGREEPVGWSVGDRYSTSQELIRTRPWFHELARHGLTVGLVNVPLTWPAFPLPRGSWMVSGFPIGDPGRAWRWPASLDVSGYPIDAVVADSHGGPGGTRDVGALGLAEERIADWLLQHPRADVEVVWLRSTDAAGHHHWGTRLYAEAVYRASAVAARLAGPDAENVLVISDHGFDATGSHRCAAYAATNHGTTATRCRLPGSHSEEGILFARGDRVHARGFLPEQRLTEVAGGIFDLLQLPPPPGVISAGPAWASALSAADALAIGAQLTGAGYGVGSATEGGAE